MRLTRATIWGLGVACLVLVGVGVVAVVSKMQGPTFFDVELGIVSDTARQFSIKAPNGWFAGISVVPDRQYPIHPEARLTLSIEIEGETVIKKTLRFDELSPSNWIPGGGRHVPLKNPGAAVDLQHRLGYKNKFELHVQTENFEPNHITVWIRFVDDRLFKPTDSGRIISRVEYPNVDE